MRQARILFRDEDAGILVQQDNGAFTFRYLDAWVNAVDKPNISMTFPKSEREFHARYLFPFFYNMLPEGSNRQVVCKYHRIDENDDFGLLMTCAKADSIGAVRVIQLEENEFS